MQKWVVQTIQRYMLLLIVEAENEDDAREKALDILDEGGRA